MAIEIHRVGVLTGGGDCPGLNAVLRAIVKTAVNEFNWEVLGIEDGFEGLILPQKVRPLGLAEVRGILPRGGTILGTTNRANPFQYLLKTDAGDQFQDVSPQVVRYAAELGLDILIVIGGDGSLSIAYELMQLGLPVFGVPKTIDNDLGRTAVTFGFDTAINTAMEALDRLHTTAESHHRILILELMGRDAGWIALEAGIAGGADVILIPEIPYRLDVILEKIHARNQRGARFSLVVAAEGAHPAGGQPVFQATGYPGAPKRLGGIGEQLAGELQEQAGMEVRVTVLGHLQRGGSPTAFDRLLASRFGAMSVHYISQGRIGHMVALQNNEITSVPLSEAISRQKLVPLDSDLLLTAQGLDISLGNSRQAIQGFET